MEVLDHSVLEHRSMKTEDMIFMKESIMIQIKTDESSGYVNTFKNQAAFD